MSLFDTFLMWFIFGSFALAFLLTILCRNRPAASTAIGLLLICAGMGLFVALASQYQIAIFGDDAEGVIEELVSHRQSTRPIVRFTDAAGEEVRFKCRQGVSRTTYEIGQTVPVRYLETNPPVAAIADRRSLWQPLIIGTLFSLTPLIASGFILRRILPKRVYR